MLMPLDGFGQLAKHYYRYPGDPAYTPVISVYDSTLFLSNNDPYSGAYKYSVSNDTLYLEYKGEGGTKENRKLKYGLISGEYIYIKNKTRGAVKDMNHHAKCPILVRSTNFTNLERAAMVKGEIGEFTTLEEMNQSTKLKAKVLRKSFNGFALRKFYFKIPLRYL